MNNFYNIDLQKMRLYNNGLLEKFSSADECIESLIGIQCQYQTYALISIYFRTKNIVNIFNNTNLIKSWGQRTTLHIYHKNDYNLISDLYCQNNNWVYKYANSLNINYNDYLNSIKLFFETKSKIISKFEIQNIIPKYKSKEIMEWSGLLILATYHKILYGIINKDDKKIYKSNDICDNNKEFTDIIYRYFKYFGPATKQDFLHWAGLKYKNVKKDLDEFLKKFKYIVIKNTKYYYVTMPDINQIKIDYPIILGKFDPLLISYYDKEWILDGNKKTLIWKNAGQVEGIIMTGKGLSGTWHYRQNGDKVIFEIKELVPYTKSIKEKLEKKFNELGTNIFNKKIIIHYGGKNE